MPLEPSVASIGDLNPLWPAETDPGSQGDNHLRLIKAALKATFPNLTEEVTATAAQLNMLLADGLTQADLVKLAALDATASRLNNLETANVTLEALQKLVAITVTAAKINKLSAVGDADTLIHTGNLRSYDAAATTLGGQSASYYRNADNLNAGTVATGRLPMATQTQAEAGTSNSYLMTPLRSKQAVDAQVGSKMLGGTGQEWKNVYNVRAKDTVFTNNTGRPIVVMIETTGNAVGEVMGPSNVWVSAFVFKNDSAEVGTFIVPDGHDYRFTGGDVVSWTELR